MLVVMIFNVAAFVIALFLSLGIYNDSITKVRTSGTVVRGVYYDNIGGTSHITGGMLAKNGSKYSVTEELLDTLEKFKK